MRFYDLKLLVTRGPVLPLLQGHEKESVVTGAHQAQQTEADDGGDVLDARRVTDDILDLVRNLVGALQGCGVGKLEIGVEVALILIRQKTRWHLAAEECGRCAEDNQHRQRDGALANERARPADISVGGASEDPVKPIEKPPQEPVALHLRLEQQRGESGAERKGIERRQNHGDCNRDGKLLIETPSDTGDECRWYEYRG